MVWAYIQCPHCKARNEVENAPNTCLHLHVCTNCGRTLHTPPGYCCLICAFSGTYCEVSVKKKADGIAISPTIGRR